MGDIRFRHAHARLLATRDRASAIRAMRTEDLVMALAASSPDREPLLVNVLATELQNRARRAGAIAEHIAEGVVTLDEEGRVTFVNPLAESLLGPSDEIVGRRAEAALALGDREGAPLAPDALPWLAALAGAQTRAADLVLHGREGPVPVSLVAAPIRADDAVVGAIVAWRDVTDARRAEDALRLHKRLLDAVGEAIVATTVDGSILYWGKAAETLYGWRAEEVLGHNVVDVTPTQASREQGESIMARLREGQSWSGTFPVQRRDGSTFEAFVTDAPVLDARGDLVAIIGVSRPADASGDPATPK